MSWPLGIGSRPQIMLAQRCQTVAAATVAACMLVRLDSLLIFVVVVYLVDKR